MGMRKEGLDKKWKVCSFEVAVLMLMAGYYHHTSRRVMWWFAS